MPVCYQRRTQVKGFPRVPLGFLHPGVRTDPNTGEHQTGWSDYFKVLR